MNAYQNSWPEEQQHFQRQQDLIREAEQRRLVRLAKSEGIQAERAPRFQWAWLGRIRCRLSTALEHLPSRAHPAAASPDCR